MITVHTPPNYEPERRYAIGVVIGDFLGLEHRVERVDRTDVSLTAGDGRELVLADELFSTPDGAWLAKESLPSRPLASVNVSRLTPEARVTSPQLPLIFGADPTASGYFTASDRRIEMGVDIFGSVFFMLSRYEEAVGGDRDEHGRFPATESLAGQEGFLDRPIVNEYVEILWACMARLWPSLRRKTRAFRVRPSHDVDCPAYYAFYPKREILMAAAGDVLKRRSPARALGRLRSWLEVARGSARDPFDTFDWLMDRSEERGWISSFNFIAGGETQFDRPRYSLDHDMIRDLVSRIHRRGHEIGFHPSYSTVGDEAEWRAELEALKSVVPGERVRGGRQHYLRFDAPRTWRLWDGAGLEYDSTLVYADRAGFRCGTCYEYTVFDLDMRAPLKLKERPTIVMESTVISDRYMGLGTGREARDFIGALKGKCKAFDGDFAVLWHNSALTDSESEDLYLSAIS
jgi:hypothetical protein